MDCGPTNFAGALGVPRWVCLPANCDHRWGLEGEHILWYPSARLFRQPTAGDWSSVFAESPRRFTIFGPRAGSSLSLTPAITDKRRCGRGRRRRHRAGRLGQSGGGGRPERLARGLQPPALDSVVLVLRPAPESWEVQTLEG